MELYWMEFLFDDDIIASLFQYFCQFIFHLDTSLTVNGNKKKYFTLLDIQAV